MAKKLQLMAIQGKLNYMINFYRYIRQRMTLPILGVILFLLMSDFHRSLIMQLTIILMVIFFRIIDDLTDLEWDRKQHPNRILVNLNSFKFFYMFLLLSVMIFFLILKIKFFTIFIVSIIPWCYLLLKISSNKRLIRTTIGLLKYPLILGMTSSTTVTKFYAPLIYCIIFVYDLFF
jgi:hypothetical protein